MCTSLFRENALHVCNSHWQYVGYWIHELCRTSLAPVLSQGSIIRERRWLLCTQVVFRQVVMAKRFSLLGKHSGVLLRCGFVRFERKCLCGLCCKRVWLVYFFYILCFMLKQRHQFTDALKRCARRDVLSTLCHLWNGCRTWQLRWLCCRWAKLQEYLTKTSLEFF